jgi:nucleoside-diphosphate-sugar epimerase
MRLLVLGGTRFIGDRIVREALRRGDEVTVVHRGVTEHIDAPGIGPDPDLALHLDPDSRYNGAFSSGALSHVHADRADFAGIRDRSVRCDRTRSLTRSP